MYKKRILAGAIGCLLACSRMAAVMAAGQVQQIQQVQMKEETGQKGEEAGAEEKPADVKDLGLPEGTEPDYNDPDYVKRLYLQESGLLSESAPFSLKSTQEKTKSPFTGLTYTHGTHQSGKSVEHGIDVSQWQKEIDWKKVKAAGAKFVFIRCGYTSLSATFRMYEDQYFKKNIQGAYDAGIKVGIYFFSNSKTVSEAKKEADMTLSLIAPYKKMITLPVVYDFEAFNESYRAYGISKAQTTKNTITYLEMIRMAGFQPMYYSSPTFVYSMFDVPQLDGYEFWLANYTTRTSYTGDYAYWQYSSSGQISGIEGNVDCNFYYGPGDGTNEEPVPEPPETVEGIGPVTGLSMAAHTTESITVQWAPVAEAAGYVILRSASYGGIYKQVGILNENQDEQPEFTDFSVVKSQGRQYYYKVVPFIMEEDEMKYGEEPPILIAHTKRVYTFRLKTTANINLREQAGTEYPILTVVPSGSGLTYFKYTVANDGSKWYKVTYEKNGKSYTGYLSGSYVNLFKYGYTKKNVNMRSGAGLSNKITRIVPTDTKVTITDQKTDTNGTSWSYVKYTQKGKSYAGYIPTKYIDRI